MSKRTYVIELIASYTDEVTANLIVERLTEEGLLHLGYGDADIDAVVMKFTDTFGTTKVSKPDRWAASRLVKRYGSQAVVGIIQLLGERSNDKYAPVVNSVSELENKFVSVMAFLRKGAGDTIIDV